MELESIKKMSLTQLVGALHTSLTALAKNISALADKNRNIALLDISMLREHANRKLLAGDEVLESKTVIKLIDLFKEDRNTLQIMKDDMEKWLVFLDAMKQHIEEKKDIDKEEVVEIEKLKQDISKIETALRKSN